MKRLILSIVVLLIGMALSLQPRVDAQTSQTISVCPSITAPILPLGYQQLAITNSAAVAPTVPSGSQMAIVTVETASIRWRDDGTAPTTTVGVQASTNNSIVLCGNSVLTKWKAIAGGVSGNLNISYYGRQ